MGESICVNISGTAFSLLLYENVRSKYDQEGFLLGDVITKEKRTITDNDQEVVNIERIVKINSILPLPNLAYFYDNSGNVNRDKIKEFVGDQMPRVVSWFKFKHTTSFKLTLREKIVFKQLAKLFMPKATDQFTCFLLTTEIKPNCIYLYSQTFIRYANQNFQTMPMHIINLKDPNDFYKSPEDCSATFKGIVDNIDADTSLGYSVVNKLEKNLDDHISKVIEKLGEAERVMFQLEEEVRELRNKEMMDSEDEELVDVFDILVNQVTETNASSSKSDFSCVLKNNNTSVPNYAKALQGNKT
ncbi:PREDICTED: BRISC complex subunit FAM175B-like [Nicrophorus vespilloides]|uniref:BRISC complex subunit FAM175B-like n=1 Tax=Nicrophorus vespilloides TaxID=110193 RepID=A0ABM1MJT6_NICVS|nr:PREDICTED: BRISC complex subunit FAM175B-like [Nicrophorus vespilloides]